MEARKPRLAGLGHLRLRAELYAASRSALRTAVASGLSSSSRSFQMFRADSWSLGSRPSSSQAGLANTSAQASKKCCVYGSLPFSILEIVPFVIPEPMAGSLNRATSLSCVSPR